MSRIISYQLYPSGFQSPLYDEVRTGSQPDEMIVKIYRDLRVAMSSKCNTWEFRRKAINRAMDLLGYLRDWLEAQENNPRLTKHMRAFVEDTLTYISTGRRPMAITSRWECIRLDTSDGKAPRHSHHHGIKRQMADALSVPYEDYMWHWLSHPDGFTDMVCTLYVIFGTAEDDA